MKLFLLLCFTGCFLFSFAQDKNQFYALDKNMNQTVLDSSKYILWIHEKEDSNWQWDYYYTWGSLVKSQSYADHDGTILNGRFCIYNRGGSLDSTGIYDHGKKNGSFYKLKTFRPDSIETIKQYNYEEDSLVKFIDLVAERLKNKQTDTAKKDSTEKESEYPGGMASWNSYLVRNMRYPDRAISKEIQGQVRIFFMVDKDGSVSDTYIFKSVEYSLDQESLRVIRNSGKWIPAVQEGVLKKSYKVMPVNYKLE